MQLKKQCFFILWHQIHQCALFLPSETYVCLTITCVLYTFLKFRLIFLNHIFNVSESLIKATTSKMMFCFSCKLRSFSQIWYLFLWRFLNLQRPMRKLGPCWMHGFLSHLDHSFNWFSFISYPLHRKQMFLSWNCLWVWPLLLHSELII